MLGLLRVWQGLQFSKMYFALGNRHKARGRICYGLDTVSPGKGLCAKCLVPSWWGY